MNITKLCHLSLTYNVKKAKKIGENADVKSIA